MKRIRLLFCVLALGAAACGGSQTPTAPRLVPPSVTETFTGTVDLGGSDFHAFTVSFAGGAISVTLTAAGPPPTIFMGLGVGTLTAATATTPAACTLLQNASVATPAGPTAQLSGTANAGNYCVSVFDVGNQTAPVTYSVSVTHS